MSIFMQINSREQIFALDAGVDRTQPRSGWVLAGIVTALLLLVSGSAFAAAPVPEVLPVWTDGASSVSFPLTASDPDGDPLSFALLTSTTSGGHGWVELSGSQVIYHLTNLSYTGVDSVALEVDDGTSSVYWTQPVWVTPTASVDQSQTDLNASAGGTNNWQSFTPAITGELTRLGLQVSSPLDGASSPATLEIRFGEGNSGLLIHTQQIELQPLGMVFQDFWLDSPVHLVAGGQYTYVLSVPSVEVGFVFLNTADPYAGGISGHNAGTDLLFKTYMVPNQRPEARADLWWATGSNVNVPLFGNDPDGDSLTYRIQTSPDHGDAAVVAGSMGPELHYQPDPGFVGDDLLEFVVHDGLARSFSAEIVIRYDPVEIPGPESDQENNTSMNPITGPVGDTGEIRQTFTAGIGGRLDLLEVVLASPDQPGNASATLKIYEGADPATAVLLHSQTETLWSFAGPQSVFHAYLIGGTDFGTQFFFLEEHDLRLVAGRQYTFSLQTTAGSHPFVIYGDTDDYAAGALYAPYASSATADLFFSTYVMPLPAIDLMPLNGRSLANWETFPVFSTAPTVDRDYNGSGSYDVRDFANESKLLVDLLEARRRLEWLEAELYSTTLTELQNSSEELTGDWYGAVGPLYNWGEFIFGSGAPINTFTDQVNWPGPFSSYGGDINQYYDELTDRLDLLSSWIIVPSFEVWSNSAEAEGSGIADPAAYDQFLANLRAEIEATDAWALGFRAHYFDSANNYIPSTPMWTGLSEGSPVELDNIALASELPPLPPVGTFDVRLAPDYLDPNFQGSLYDFRSNASLQTQYWTIELQRPSAGTDVYLRWSRLPFEGTFVLIDECATGFYHDMHEQNQILWPTSCDALQLIRYPASAANWLHPGWNLLSAPIQSDPIDEIFATSPTSVYEFQVDSYIATDMLQPMAPGQGYWVNMPSAEEWNIFGEPVTSEMVSVPSGWSLIGGFNEEIAVAALKDQYPDVASVYGFNPGGYYFADYLIPGKGYWIKNYVAQAIDFAMLGGGGPGPKRVSARPDHSAVLVASVAGLRQELHLGAEFESELPPRPPAGTFDLRAYSDDGPSWQVPRAFARQSVLVSLQEVEQLSWVVADSLSGVWSLDIGGRRIDLDGHGSVALEPGVREAILHEQPIEPRRYALEANYPNPFNPQTAIRYSLAGPGRVTLAIYDVLGRRVRTLVDHSQAAGRYQVEWNGLDDQGRSVASGTYLYRLDAGSFRQTAKMSLVR